MSAIKLYRFAKKVMSTDLPSDIPFDQELVDTITGTFRAPYDVLNPVVRIENNATLNFAIDPPNYCEIGEGMGESVTRYYWIDKFIWITDTIIDLYLSEDYLATWESAIKESSQYVVRAASAWNGDLQDGLYPLENTQSGVFTDISSLIPWYSATGYALTDGWYVIGVLNKDDNAVGSASYYALNYAAFQSFRNALFSDASWTEMDFTQIEEPLYKSLFNPMQYVISCMWFPTKPTKAVGSTITMIPLGWWTAPAFAKSGSEAFRIEDPISTGTFNLPSVQHPTAATRGIWLNTQPYTQRTLYIEPFGSIDLDTTKLAFSGAFPRVQWWIDYITGAVRVRVDASTTHYIIGEGQAMLGVSVELAQQTQNSFGYAAGRATEGVLNFVDKLGFSKSGYIAGPLSEIGKAGAAPNVQSTGSFAGSLISGKITPYDQTMFSFPANDDLANRGRPLCEVRTLNTLQGYVLCANAHLAISNMLGDERRAIESALNSGIYLE